jgi:hypothetical protein
MTTPEEFNKEAMKLGKLRWSHIEKLARFWQAHHGLLIDGKIGKYTCETLVDDEPSELAMEVVRILKSEYGHGESDHFNNSGADIARYKRVKYVPGKRMHGAWCAWFASYVLDEACGGEGKGLGPQPTAKGLVRRLGESSLGRFVDLSVEPILPGDFIAWDSVDPNAPEYAGHVGIAVLRSDERGRFRYGDGNVGRYPALVGERRGYKSNKRIVQVARPL